MHYKSLYLWLSLARHTATYFPAGLFGRLCRQPGGCLTLLPAVTAVAATAAFYPPPTPCTPFANVARKSRASPLQYAAWRDKRKMFGLLIHAMEKGIRCRMTPVAYQ